MKWTELFPLKETTRECIMVLLDEITLKFRLPRKIISDNGAQFTSSVMQHLCNRIKIDQLFTPAYHAQSNPVERKNRDLKSHLARLFGNDH